MFQKEDSKEEDGEEDKPVEALEWNDEEEEEEDDDEVFEDAVENTVGHFSDLDSRFWRERSVLFCWVFVVLSSSNLYFLSYFTESDRVLHQLSAQQSGLAGLCGQQQPGRYGEGAEGKV